MNHAPTQSAPVIGPHEFVGWFFKPDDLLGWRMIPGRQAWFVKPGIRSWVQINADGFRGDPFPSHKKSKDKRILLLADSFGVAIEVDEADTFSNIMKRRLQEIAFPQSQDLALLNASVGGYGTEQEFLYLKEYGENLTPDIILLAFHFGDDLIENSLLLRQAITWRLVKLPRPYLRSNDGGALPLQLEGYPPDPGEIQRAWTHYYDFLPIKLRNQVQDSSMGQTGWLYRRLREAIHKRWQNFRKGRSIPLDLMIYSSQPDETFEKAWQHTACLLEAIHQEVIHSGSRLFVIGICTKEQILPDYLNSRLSSNLKSQHQIDPYYPNQRLNDILTKLKVPFFDLTPHFAEAQRTGINLFFEKDLHWNTNGHALAGNLLASAIADYL